jgi:hypothetical protein
MPYLSLVVLLASLAQVVAADDVVLYSRLDSISYSEPTSIYSLLHEFSGDLEDGDTAVTYNKVELGIQYKFFSVALLQRYDYFAAFSPDLATAYYQSGHNIKPDSEYVYDTYVRASHIRSAGLKFGVELQPVKNLTFWSGLSFLRADQMIDGVMRGDLSLRSENEYQGLVHYDAFSYRDMILEEPVPDPKGDGYALDIGFAWKISDRWYAQLEVIDAYSRIQWEGVLESHLNATSATINYDADGRLRTSPALSGTRFLVDTEQILPVKYAAEIHYQFDRKNLFFIEAMHISSYITLPTLGYGYRFYEDHSLSVLWSTKTQAAGVRYKNQWLTIEAAVDDLNGRKAHAWQLSLEFRVPLQI